MEMFKKKSLQDVCKRAVEIIQGFLDEGKVTQQTIADSRGLVILESQHWAIGSGGGYGFGIIIAHRSDGTWSPPIALNIASFGGGVACGFQRYKRIYVLRTAESVNTFAEKALKVDSRFAAAAGTLWKTLTVHESQDVLEYTKSLGLFIGLTINGSWCVQRHNTKYYGLGHSTKDILWEFEVTPDIEKDMVCLARILDSKK